MQNLSQFVKSKRKSVGLTQVDLSYKSGLGLRFIRELEQGKTSLQMNKVNQALALFGHELSPTPIDRNEAR
jgi:y4mF family transcriptional regulator